MFYKTETTMSELTELLDRVEKIASRPVIPADVALWDSAHVGAYLQCTGRTVCERYAPMPDFPKAIRLPTVTGSRGHPLWPAQEVMAWAAKYREKN